MPPINVGIIGYGTSAKVFHIPFILPHPDLKLHAILQRAEAPKEKSPSSHCTIDHPDILHHRTTDTFFSDPSIDLVVICTPHATHHPLAKQSLLAGKHTIVEKPFTITSAEADELIALSESSGKQLHVFQNRRYDSDFLTLKHYISRNTFGEITEFENYYDVHDPIWIHTSSSPPAAPGDGLLYGLGSHSIDQTLQLFGRPERITAFTRNLIIESGADDTFTLLLQYAEKNKNLLSTIKTSVVTPISQHKILKYRLRGTKGVFIKTGEDVQVEHLLEKKLPVTDGGFGVEPGYYHPYLSTRNDGVEFEGTVPSLPGRYVDYYGDVVKAIKGEGEIVCKAEEGRDVIRVIELARESAEKGVTVGWS